MAGSVLSACVTVTVPDPMTPLSSAWNPRLLPVKKRKRMETLGDRKRASFPKSGLLPQPAGAKEAASPTLSQRWGRIPREEKDTAPWREIGNILEMGVSLRNLFREAV